MSLKPFVTKLATLVELSQSEIEALHALPYTTKTTPAYRDVIAKGDHPSYLYVVLHGWAGRYNLRTDGSRRITGFLLPGDFCGIHAVCHAPIDHGITALTECELGMISLKDFEPLVKDYESINRALWKAKLADESILRTWLLNSTDAARTLAHLICEVDARLHPADDTNERSFYFPLTQEQLGDALGITAVHTNRTHRLLREAGLVDVANRDVHIPDVAALRRYASFDAGYLHAGSVVPPDAGIF